MRTLGILLVTVCAASRVAGQTQPVDVVNRLFDAMRAQDTAAMRATFHPEKRLLTTGTTPQGAPRAQFVPVEAWLRGIAAAPARPDERLYDVEQRVDGPLATVWARYDLFVGENFIHCGYDAFQLAQVSGEWKLVAGADTQRRDPARCGRGTAPVADTPPSPADTAAVLTVVQQLFDGMRTRDSVVLKRAMLDQARLFAIDERGTMRHTVAADFIAQIARGTGGELHERMYDPEVRISDQLATVWTFYDFYRGDQFSHCGYDYFQLARTADGWKIAQISYTVRRTQCERVRK